MRWCRVPSYLRPELEERLEESGRSRPNWLMSGPRHWMFDASDDAGAIMLKLMFEDIELVEN